MGPLRKRVFSYEYLFRAVRIHLLVDPPAGDAQLDGRSIVEAMRAGRGWVAYDLPKPTTGFRFRARSAGGEAGPGESLPYSAGVSLDGGLPSAADWRLIRAGTGVVRAGSGGRAEFRPTLPGAYRLEAYRRFRGRRVGWIFSNPIYLVE
jgi:hypothetical protein